MNDPAANESDLEDLIVPAIVSIPTVAAGFGILFLAAEYSSPDGYGGDGLFVSLVILCPTALGLALALIGRYGRRAFPVLVLDVIAILVGLGLLGETLLGSMIRKSSFRAACANNLGSIGKALQAYHADHGCFPPAYVADASGRPMHSWRMLIMPYLEQTDVAERYRLDESWDSAANRDAAASSMLMFRCPSNRKRDPPGMTSYVAVVGPRTAWPGTTGSKLDDFADGPENTILLVEMAGSGIECLEPRDLHVGQMVWKFNPTSGQGPSSRHEPSGVNALFADGRVRFLRGDLPPDVVHALLSRNGGEKVDPEDCQYVFGTNHP